MAEWINPAYMNSGTLKELRKQFEKQKPIKSIQLQSFLKEDSFLKLLDELRKARYKQICTPDLFSYHEAEPKGILIDAIMLMASQRLQHILKEITGIRGKTTLYKPQYFGWKDYTIMNDMQKLQNGIVFFLDVTPHWEDVGGETVYLTPKQEALTIYPTANTLSIVRTSKKTRMFVKYVNNYAGKNKRYLIGGTILTNRS